MNKQLGALSLQIKIDGDEAAAEVDQITRNLLREIDHDIPVETSALKTQVAPKGTRAAEAITIGVIVLTILPVFFDKLTNLVISWAQRNNENTVTISIPVEGGQITLNYNPKKNSLQEVKEKIREVKQAIGIKE